MAGEREQCTATLGMDLELFTAALESAVDGLSNVMGPDKAYILRVELPATVPLEWLLELGRGCAAGVCEYLWCEPNEQLYLAGCGIAAELRATGANRFEDIQGQMASYSPVEENFLQADEMPPTWIGGYSFDPTRNGFPWQKWPDARFVMPRWQFRSGLEESVTYQAVVRTTDDLDALLTSAAMELKSWLAIETGSAWTAATRDTREPNDVDRSARVKGTRFDDWCRAIEATTADIQSGLYRKAVIARCEPARLPERFSLIGCLQFLTTAYPESVTFVIRNGDELFVGASPERLVDVRKDEVHVDCLAGSIRRGSTPAEDEALGQQLLSSEKDLHEHSVVVDWIVNSIADEVTDLGVGSAPALRRLANVQHLYTPVHGILSSGGVQHLVQRLHPTPAVAGDPRDAALNVIKEREAVARGWYAGAVGMVTTSGDGTFIVGLRSALITKNYAYLFAGAGIMAASSPEREWQETQWKMRPMQAAVQQS